jgi:ABC-type multidrug transport system ATPase subunit
VAAVTPFLVADCVTRAFGSRRVLSAGSLRAVGGQVRVLLGRNGSGKSTLMKIAAGVLRADSGEVFVEGKVVDRPTQASMARAGVFFLPDHDLLSPSFTLGEQLAFFSDRFAGAPVDEAAERTGTTEFLRCRPHTLSGGEQRRAELAAVIARRPACLLADEPYRGIAPVDHDRLTAIFRGLAANGCAVVVTGHEVPSLMELADHVTWCTSGTTYELGPPGVAARHEGFRADYLAGTILGSRRDSGTARG